MPRVVANPGGVAASNQAKKKKIAHVSNPADFQHNPLSTSNPVHGEEKVGLKLCKRGIEFAASSQVEKRSVISSNVRFLWPQSCLYSMLLRISYSLYFTACVAAMLFACVSAILHRMTS